MNKVFSILILFLIVLGSCNSSEIIEESNPETSVLNHYETESDRELLISQIQNNLTNKVDIASFIDSLTNQDKIEILDTLIEYFDESTRKKIYKSDSYEFSLKNSETDSKSNTLFFDGNTVIDFSKHKILVNNDHQYKTEEFGFNFRNRLYKPMIIKILNKEFLYADIIFDCNGKGCGCTLNFIYDLKSKKPFFLNNFRFPFDNYFISDFNDDGIIDLLVISRMRNNPVKGLKISQSGYKATWFEYKNDNFIVKKGANQKDSYSYEFVAYSANDEYPDTDYSLIIND